MAKLDARAAAVVEAMSVAAEAGLLVEARAVVVVASVPTAVVMMMEAQQGDADPRSG